MLAFSRERDSSRCGKYMLSTVFWTELYRLLLMQFVQWPLENVWFMREDAGGGWYLWATSLSLSLLSFLFCQVSIEFPQEDYFNSFVALGLAIILYYIFHWKAISLIGIYIYIYISFVNNREEMKFQTWREFQA